MSRTLDILWHAAGAILFAYIVGDILNFWNMELLVIIVAAPVLLFLGRNVGKAEKKRG